MDDVMLLKVDVLASALLTITHGDDVLPGFPVANGGSSVLALNNSTILLAVTSQRMKR